MLVERRRRENHKRDLSYEPAALTGVRVLNADRGPPRAGGAGARQGDALSRGGGVDRCLASSTRGDDRPSGQARTTQQPGDNVVAVVSVGPATAALSCAATEAWAASLASHMLLGSAPTFSDTAPQEARRALNARPPGAAARLGCAT